MKNKLKNSKGITLIALVITIIVLLILAGVAISMLAGDNGILRQAARAKKETENSTKKEMADLLEQEIYLESKTNGITEDTVTNLGYKINEKKDNKPTIITKNETSLILDEKTGNVLARVDSQVIDDLTKIRDAYEAINKSKHTVLENVYVYSYEGNSDKPERNAVATKEYIKYDYNSNKYLISVQSGNLVCLYDNNQIMTEEKIIACEAMGIYLLGDIDGNHKLDYWDVYYMNAKINEGYIPDNMERFNVVADVDGSIIFNDLDTNCLEITMFLWEIRKPLVEMKNTFDEYIITEEEKEVNIETINANTIEEIQQYIPEYNGALNYAYEFRIRKGKLFYVYDKTKNVCPRLIRATNIEIIGDVNGDYLINSKDETFWKRWVARDYEKAQQYLKDYDLDDNGVVDERDFQTLKEMID